MIDSSNNVSAISALTLYTGLLTFIHRILDAPGLPKLFLCTPEFQSSAISRFQKIIKLENTTAVTHINPV